MKNIILAIVFCLYAALAFSMPAEQWMIGKWRVIKVQGYAPTFESFDERSLIGKYFIIQKDSASFNGKKIAIKSVEVTRENTLESFDFGFRMNPYKLELPKEVTQIKLNYSYTDFHIYYLYISGENSMIFEYNGVFYKAIRSK